MSSKVFKGKRYSFVLNEDRLHKSRESKLHQKFASIEKNMSKYTDSGVSLWINDQVCTPREFAHYCIKHDGRFYHPDMVADGNGNLTEIHFDII